MFSHVFIGITDFDRALAFYNSIAAELGLVQKFVEHDRPWAGWHAKGQDRPLFLIGTPFDDEPAVPGNGNMAAFMADSREMVCRVHAAALQSGGECEGPPGLREEYHPHYYGAYFRDPDGNKLAVVCHTPDA